MGSALADGILQGDATGSAFRTPPLWGVSASYPWLHDGRAGSLRQAIILPRGPSKRYRRGGHRSGDGSTRSTPFPILVWFTRCGMRPVLPETLALAGTCHVYPSESAARRSCGL